MKRAARREPAARRLWDLEARLAALEAAVFGGAGAGDATAAGEIEDLDREPDPLAAATAGFRARVKRRRPRHAGEDAA